MPLSEGLLSISNHLDPSAALTLSPSSRLGHYDILAEPGARGMGVLSRASRATAPPSSPAAFPATRRSWCRLSRPGSLDNLPNAQLCPGNDALQKLMQQFRYAWVEATPSWGCLFSQARDRQAIRQILRCAVARTIDVSAIGRSRVPHNSLTPQPATAGHEPCADATALRVKRPPRHHSGFPIGPGPN